MNNSIIPGWNFESDSCFINQKNPIWPDQELGELLWQNGQVIIQSQTQKKQVENNKHYSSSYYDSRKVHQKNDVVSTSNLSQQDEIVSSWIQYPIIDQDPILLEQQQQNSNLLSQFSPCDEFESFNKPIIKQVEEGKKFTKFDPRFHHVSNDSSQRINDFCGSKKAPKFAHFSAKFIEKVNASNNHNNNMSQNNAKECSVMTIGSSHCGSNHILQEQDASKVSSSGVWDNTTTIFSAENEEGVRDYYSVQRTNNVPWSGKGKSRSDMVEPTLTSSSGGSGSTSLAKTCSLSTGNHGLKRKVSDADELEEQSEATEPNSAIGNKASQRSGSSKRNRSAEVHNLSERRRRDRINEKMRTLQQLIPNSNKTDKASVLEEAVEYMKSLQLQLQIMWMGAGIAPVMFPGIQNYMSQMCMGIAATATPSSLPSTIQHHHPMQLPRMPPLDQSISVAQAQNKAIMCQNPVLGAFNYQNQMQNPCIAEQYARYMMAYHNLMQSASQQPMNVFGYCSTNVTQPSPTMIAPSNNSGPMNEALNFDHAMSGIMGSSTF